MTRARAGRRPSRTNGTKPDFSKGRRGAVVKVPRGKTRITIRLDDDVLDWFRKRVHAAGGGNYQTLINAALHEHVAHQREPLEATLRRVICEGCPAKLQARGRDRPRLSIQRR